MEDIGLEVYFKLDNLMTVYDNKYQFSSSDFDCNGVVKVSLLPMDEIIAVGSIGFLFNFISFFLKKLKDHNINGRKDLTIEFRVLFYGQIKREVNISMQPEPVNRQGTVFTVYPNLSLRNFFILAERIERLYLEEESKDIRILDRSHDMGTLHSFVLLLAMSEEAKECVLYSKSKVKTVNFYYKKM